MRIGGDAMRLGTLLWIAMASGTVLAQANPSEELTIEKLASQVTIYRDQFGVPHIDAATDTAAMFASMYAQCEDYFWQVEDNYILSLGDMQRFTARTALRRPVEPRF